AERLERLACLGWPVVHAHADRAHAPRGELGRTAPLRAVTRHIGHRAVIARRKPLVEAALVLFEVDTAHAERIEPQLAGSRREVAFDRLEVELGIFTGGVHRQSIISRCRCRSRSTPPRKYAHWMRTRSAS